MKMRSPFFVPTKRARNAQARLQRAKLTIVVARERAARMAQHAALTSTVLRTPNVLQRRRLAESSSAKVHTPQE
jgi:hypothetical protein